jgi:hypothetical protein
MSVQAIYFFLAGEEIEILITPDGEWRFEL